jgi:hypothetical protein
VGAAGTAGTAGVAALAPALALAFASTDAEPFDVTAEQ